MSERTKRRIYIMTGVGVIAVGWATLDHNPLAIPAIIMGVHTLVNGLVGEEDGRG